MSLREMIIIDLRNDFLSNRGCSSPPYENDLRDNYITVLIDGSEYVLSHHLMEHILHSEKVPNTLDKLKYIKQEFYIGTVTARKLLGVLYKTDEHIKEEISLAKSSIEPMPDFNAMSDAELYVEVKRLFMRGPVG